MATGQGKSASPSESTFADLLPSAGLQRAVRQDCGYERPNEIQARLIGAILSGADLLCQGPPGCGKTAGLALGVTQRLLTLLDDANRSGGASVGTRALALCHSRELAAQFARRLRILARRCPFKRPRVAEFLGGAPCRRDSAIAASLPDIAVGTPGRMLMALARCGHLRTDQLRLLVLDECDQLMLRSEHVKQLIEASPAGLQIVMCCTTVVADVRLQCLQLMQRPVDLSFVASADEANKLAPPSLLQYRVSISDQSAKNLTLLRLLRLLEFDQAIIFASSPRQCASIERYLKRRAFQALAVHGEVAQNDRMKSFVSFRKRRHRVLIATDLYARGLQFDRVNLVINYCAAGSAEDYLHRVGRAVHFGSRGLAISLVATAEEAQLLNQAESRLLVQIEELPAAINTADYLPPSLEGDGADRAGVILIDLNGKSCRDEDWTDCDDETLE